MQMYKLLIARQVERDLTEIELYVMKLGGYSSNITVFLEHVYDSIESLLIYPFLGIELNKQTLISTGLRYLVIDNYLIFYEVIGNEINVYRVLSQRTDYIQRLGLI